MEAERPSRVRRAAQLVAAALVAGTIAAAVTGGMGASIRVQASLYSGGAFDTCTVPSNATLNAWLAGPYRGVGIYIGGVNRACANTNLTPTWLANTLASGWNVIPTYVGLQAPCTTVKKLATIAVDGTAGTQGTAAAVDAAARAAALGIPTGSPIYLDIEGYPLNNPSCSQVVEAFAAGWVTGLHARGYITGVYGSAASTIRDMVALAGVTTPPDAVWIANWNDVTSVYGDKYIADGYWATHQRLHPRRIAHGNRQRIKRPGEASRSRSTATSSTGPSSAPQALHPHRLFRSPHHPSRRPLVQRPARRPLP